MSSSTQVTAKARVRAVSVRTRLLGVARVFVGRIPPIFGNYLADRLGDVAYYAARKSRRNAIDNMRHVLGPQATRYTLRKTVRGVFHNVMRNYFDLFRAPNTSNEAIDRSVDFDQEGWERVAALQAQGRGVILATAHFGSFDMMTQVITRKGLHLTVLVARISPAWLSDFITQLRGSRGLELLEVEEEEASKLNLGALKKAVTVLRDGGMLGVVADRNIEPSGIPLCFFGEEAIVAAGVAKMAIRTKSAVVPSICFRLPRNRYEIIFEEPILPPDTGSNQENARLLLQQLFSRFEHHFARNPEQWVILQRVWHR